MKPFKSVHLLLVLAISILLTGCSAVKEASKESDFQAKKMTPPAGKSLLYVVRPSSLGFAVSFEVFIDEKYIGTTGGSRYIYAVVAPGKHLLKSSAENDAFLPLNAVADSTYFVRQNVSMGLLKARNELELLNPFEGRAAMMDCSLSSECVEIMPHK